MKRAILGLVIAMITATSVYADITIKVNDTNENISIVIGDSDENKSSVGTVVKDPTDDTVSTDANVNIAKEEAEIRHDENAYHKDSSAAEDLRDSSAAEDLRNSIRGTMFIAGIVVILFVGTIMRIVWIT